MPLFRRSDGDLVTGESPVRRMLPFMIRTRNEAAIYHDAIVDLTKTRGWMRAWNRAHPDDPITLFHLFLHCMARGLHARPGMNRFVMANRIYQRKVVSLSFAAKRKFEESSELVTVKMDFPDPAESFLSIVRRIKDTLGDGRENQNRAVDKEVRLALSLPAPVLRVALGLLRWLDSVNLMPASMIKNDPMYTSAFVANLGSVGIDRTYHHLHEYGTASLFGVIGVPRKVPVAVGDRVEVREQVEVRWAFDERINDGFYCATAIRHYSRYVEDPARYIGPPDSDGPGDANKRADGEGAHAEGAAAKGPSTHAHTTGDDARAPSPTPAPEPPAPRPRGGDAAPPPDA